MHGAQSSQTAEGRRRYRYVYLIFLRRQRQRPDNTRRRRRRSRLRCGSIAFRHPWVQFYNSALEDRPFDNVEWSFDSTTSVPYCKVHRRILAKELKCDLAIFRMRKRYFWGRSCRNFARFRINVYLFVFSARWSKIFSIRQLHVICI